VNLAVVVQRYGADINGGAELHARYIAERLAGHARVEVLTTCARDYITWRNELPPGVADVQGIPVRRFPVDHERDPRAFGRRSSLVFDRRHSLADELAWLDSEGPASRSLLEHLSRERQTYDFVLFFSYRYHHAYHGVRTVPGRAVLVPTAERDPAIGLAIFGPIFRGVRAVMYNSHEERHMIQAAAANENVPGVIVGVGSQVPDRTSPERFRQAYRVDRPFVVYVGRIDENKGCAELFDYFQRYAAAVPRGVQLLLIGNAFMPVPKHPGIRHLGFLPDEDKFDAIAASEALIMPSYYESLSMVTLEAWALGRPVLANGRCDVLKGQCIRSDAGLYYESCEEFVEALVALASNLRLNRRLGQNGRAFYERHYTWPVIERKYLQILEGLKAADAAARRGLEPLPGWLARRRRTLRPAREVLAGLRAGAVGQPA
jgi:glycosyltransferase involved in cell wall biosynthesis